DFFAGLRVGVEGEDKVAVLQLVGVFQADDCGGGAFGFRQGLHDGVDLQAEFAHHGHALFVGHEDTEGAGTVSVDVGEGELGVFGAGGGGLVELPLDVVDQFLGFLALTEGLADDLDLLVPFNGPGQFRVGDGGGDVVEDVVLLLGDSGPGGQDDVGFQFDDGFEVDVFAAGELDGEFFAGFGDGFVNPRQVAGLVAAPLVAFDTHGDGAERDRGFG